MLEGKLNLWEQQLRNLLVQLEKGEITLIEFGQPKQHLSDVFTRVRIRITKVDGQPTGIHACFVHVFYGEQLAPVYSLDDTGRELCIQAVMQEVKDWTEARANVGKKYTADINDGLEFSGFQVDRYSASAGI